MRYDDISDLPAAVQKQALQKLAAAEIAKQKRKQDPEQQKKKTKYNNAPTAVSGIRFDSKKEAGRYEQLVVLLHAGTIRDLKLQPEFTLQEAFTTPSGERVRAIRYKADFSYRDSNGALVIEDVKSEATRKNRVYINKKKQMVAMGYVVKEI